MTVESKTMGIEAVIAYFKALSRHSSGGTDENHGNNQSVCRPRFEKGIGKITVSYFVIFIRFYRVLTMVYNTQNYWVFGLCPSSGF
jgi:hypothetical protein